MTSAYCYRAIPQIRLSREFNLSTFRRWWPQSPRYRSDKNINFFSKFQVPCREAIQYYTWFVSSHRPPWSQNQNPQSLYYCFCPEKGLRVWDRDGLFDWHGGGRTQWSADGYISLPRCTRFWVVVCARDQICIVRWWYKCLMGFFLPHYLIVVRIW